MSDNRPPDAAATGVDLEDSSPSTFAVPRRSTLPPASTPSAIPFAPTSPVAASSSSRSTSPSVNRRRSRRSRFLRRTPRASWPSSTPNASAAPLQLPLSSAPASRSRISCHCHPRHGQAHNAELAREVGIAVDIDRSCDGCRPAEPCSQIGCRRPLGPQGTALALSTSGATRREGIARLARAGSKERF